MKVSERGGDNGPERPLIAFQHVRVRFRDDLCQSGTLSQMFCHYERHCEYIFGTLGEHLVTGLSTQDATRGSKH